MSCSEHHHHHHQHHHHHHHHHNHHQFPSLGTRSGDGVLVCPVHNSPVLYGNPGIKLSGVTFWKSPYNGVAKVNSSGSTTSAKSAGLGGSQSDSARAAGFVKGILKKSKSRDSESEASSVEEDRKLRGILARGDSADAKRGSGKRVKFDDKLVKLHEIGRRYAPVAPWVDTRASDDHGYKPYSSDANRILREISVNRPLEYREVNIWNSSRVLSGKKQLFAKTSTAIDAKMSDSTNTHHGTRWQTPVGGQYRLLFEGDRVTSARSYNENTRTVDLERNVYPRLCRSFTSPMLYSHKSPRKSSPSQNMVIYRHEMNTPEGRISSMSVKSAGNSPRQRMVFQAPSVLSDKSDGVPVHPNFCNDDKTSQIVRWLRNVNETHPKEGRCTVFLPLSSSHDLRES